MKRILATLGLAVVLSTPVFAADRADPAARADRVDLFALLKHQQDTYNHGDAAGMSADCTDDAVVIDNFPPHLWQGSSACARWLADLTGMLTATGLTDGAIAMGKPRHLDVSGDRAYAVLPADFRFRFKGKPGHQRGQMTFAFRKVDASWRIAGWTWSDQ